MQSALALRAFPTKRIAHLNKTARLMRVRNFEPALTATGQQPRLPQCNIGSRSAPINGHRSPRGSFGDVGWAKVDADPRNCACNGRRLGQAFIRPIVERSCYSHAQKYLKSESLQKPAWVIPSRAIWSLSIFHACRAALPTLFASTTGRRQVADAADRAGAELARHCAGCQRAARPACRREGGVSGGAVRAAPTRLQTFITAGG
jgi:hypothetical protein